MPVSTDDYVSVSDFLGRYCWLVTNWLQGGLHLPRHEYMTACAQAREAEFELTIAYDKNGKFVASHGDNSANNGAFPQGADSNIAAQMLLWTAYKMPAGSFLTRGWYGNTNGIAAYRGPWAIESLVRETAMDKAARVMGIDPIELRRRNLLQVADQPCATSMSTHSQGHGTATTMTQVIADRLGVTYEDVRFSKATTCTAASAPARRTCWWPRSRWACSARPS